MRRPASADSCLGSLLFAATLVLLTATAAAAPANLVRHPGGIRAVVPGSNTWSPTYINDGTTGSSSSQAWLSAGGVFNNLFEFTFDPNLSGITGEGGDSADRFRLDNVRVFVPGNTWSLKDFALETRTGAGPWRRLYSAPAVAGAYNYARTAAGGIRAVVPGSSTWSPVYINDGVTGSIGGRSWLSAGGVFNNVFEFTFDPNLNATTGEGGDAADLFNLDAVAVYVPGNTWSLKDFSVETQTGSSTWRRLHSPQPLPNPYNFAKTASGGNRAVVPGSSTWSPVYINDGVTGSIGGRSWLSAGGVFNNTFEFTFDPNLNGTAGEGGVNGDRFTLDSLAMYVPGNTWSLKDFMVDTQSGGGPWKRLYSSSAPVAAYNFAKTAAGGVRAVQPGSSTWSPVYINDGVTGSIGGRSWLSAGGVFNNTFEFTFDPNLNGTAGEGGVNGDRFTLDSLAMYVPGNTWSLKDFMVDTQSGGGPWKRLYSSSTPIAAYNFAKTASGGIRAVEPGSSTWSPVYINDGVTGSIGGRSWLSAGGVFNNTFEFTFDPNLNGTAGEGGDQFTLDTLALYVPGNTWSMKDFTVETQSGGGPWQRLYSAGSVAGAYNFAQTAAGGIRAVVPGSSTWSPVYINDGVTGNIGGRSWLSAGGVFNNTFEFTFDPQLNGTAGEAGDRFTLDAVAVYVPGNSWSLRNFEVTVQTGAGWQAPVALQAAQVAGAQVFAIGPYTDVIRVRLRTLSNWGDGSYLQINEFETRGTWSGANPLFTAAQAAGEQTFNVAAVAANNDGRRNNLTRLRFTTLNNRGDGSYQQVDEFEVRGVWNGANPVFTAAQAAGEQTFNLAGVAANNDGRRDDITRLRLTTLSNRGDGSYQQIDEFEVRGAWSGSNPVFTAAQAAGEQVFGLAGVAANNDGRRDDITRLRLTTLSNRGDGSYQQVDEFEARGVWSGPNPVFTAAQAAGEQAFDLTGVAANNDGRRSGVTRLRLTTLSNRGDGSYQQIDEFEARGAWGGPNPVFTAAQVAGQQIFDLTGVAANNDGRRNDVTRLRLTTLSNRGDGSYQQINEFEGWGEVGASIGGFAAYEPTSPACSAIAGNLHTKIAGTPPAAVNVNVAALNAARTAIETAFNDTVKVELLAINAGSPALDGNGCPVGASVLASVNQALAGGCATMALPSTAEAWRYAKLRISYPASSPTVTTCSGDAFAIRPVSPLTAAARHADWENPGDTADLINASASGAPIHKAGRNFTLKSTGLNQQGAVTANYNGIPAAVAGSPTLTAGMGTVPGPFSAGSFAAVGGSVVSNDANYGEVGGITLQLEDRDFASIDNADGSPDWVIAWPALTIGRFVPDRLSLTLPAITPACGAFTYFGQSGLRAGLTLTAQNAAGVTTQNYQGGLAKFDPASYAAYGFSAAGLPAGSAVVAGTGATGGAWAVGTLLLLPATGPSPLFSRPAAPAGPSTATLSATPADSDGVTVAAPVALGTADLRFGRLRLLNAHGSELRPLPLTLRAESWNGSGFALNTLDNCTSLAAGAFGLANWRNLAAGSTAIAGAGPWASAGGNFAGLRLGAPAPAGQGSVDVTVTTPAWLQGGAAFNANAGARATFGVYRDAVLFRRENF